MKAKTNFIDRAHLYNAGGLPHKLHHGKSLTLPPVDQLHTNGRLNLKYKYQCSKFLRRMFSVLRANVQCS